MNTMKRYISYIALMALAMSLWNCMGEYEHFVDSSEVITGKPSSIQNINYEPLPGEIKLSWDIPSDSSLSYIKINYFDHLSGENISKVASVYTNELIIPETRERYGDYDFSFQTFNSKHEGGDIAKLKARSGRAPITETFHTTKVSLEDGQFSTDNQEPSEGPIRNLNDGNPNSFFHTRWSSPQVPMPQYIQIDLNEPLTNFSFSYQNRNGSQVGPEHLRVLISTDNTNWLEVANFTSGLPSASLAIYNSPVIRNSEPFTYVRFSVTKTFGDRKYFNLAEFSLYKVDISIFDPEVQN